MRIVGWIRRATRDIIQQLFGLGYFLDFQPGGFGLAGFDMPLFTQYGATFHANIMLLLTCADIGDLCCIFCPRIPGNNARTIIMGDLNPRRAVNRQSIIYIGNMSDWRYRLKGFLFRLWWLRYRRRVRDDRISRFDRLCCSNKTNAQRRAFRYGQLNRIRRCSCIPR